MKCSWYNCEGFSSRQFQEASATLLKRTFRANSLTGFKIDSVLPNTFEGTYIEKTEFTETLTDPFGRVTEIPRVRYDSFRFRLFKTFPQVELIDPIRSVKGFFGELSRAFGFDIILTKPRVDVRAWLERLEQKINRAEVRRMLFAGIDIEHSATGQLTVSGDTDVRRAAEIFLRSKKAELEKLSFRGEIDSAVVSCELSSACRAMVDGEDLDHLVGILRRGLAATIPNPL